MAELADAADSKSAEVHPSWGFNSPSRHQRAVCSDRREESLLTLLNLNVSLNRVILRNRSDRIRNVLSHPPRLRDIRRQGDFLSIAMLGQKLKDCWWRGARRWPWL